MTEPQTPYVTEPLPPLSDYAVLLQRLSAHLSVVAGLVHDLAEYEPAPAQVRGLLAQIAASFSFMDKGSPEHSPEVQRALAAARARTTTSVLAQLDEYARRPPPEIIKEFREPSEPAENAIDRMMNKYFSAQSEPPDPLIIPPTCTICGGKMELSGWEFDGYALGSVMTKTMWTCPNECLPPEPDVFSWSSLLDSIPDNSHSPLFWDEPFSNPF